MSKQKHLLDLSDSDEDSDKPLNINTSNNYALKYDNWRQKEELQKLKDKYGNHLDVISDSERSFQSDHNTGSDSDSSQQSSDDSNQLEEQVFDDQFFKVYSALKSKNPSIYDKNIKFFDQNKNEDKNQNQTQVKTNEDIHKTEPKMTLKDYHKKLIKEKKGITEEDEREENELKDKPNGYFEELYHIRNEFKAVLQSDQSDDSDGELIKGKTHPISTQKQKKVNFLDDTNDQHNDKDISFLRTYWKNDNQLDESEKYLRDYIINKRFVAQKEEDLLSNHALDENQLSDSNQNNMFESIDENESNQIEVKVHKYHFEEPESLSIKRYPRNINSIRESTASDNRAIKRVEVKERKKREKDIELKRLRKLKRQELKDKLNKLREISGNDDIDVKDLDLNVLLDDENDFDSSKYDQKMELLFGDNYYDIQNNGSKPKFDYVSGVDDYHEDYNEDLTQNDDAFDNDLNIDEKSVKTKGKTSNKKNKKNKSIKDIGIYEDLIGGNLATRYRYRVVESNDFGLTDEEIMFADDKELNKWCSIKKMSQYRNDDEERYDLKSYANKANDLELKKKILKSIYADDNGNEDNKVDNSLSTVNNKKKRKKRRYKKPTFNIEPINKAKENPEHETKSNDSEIHQKSNPKKKLRKNKRKQKPKHSVESSVAGVSVERLKAYGLSNREIKKVKNKIK